MATIKSTGNEYLNTYAELKNSLKQGNYLYSDEDWAQNAKYGTLDAYIGMVSQLGKDKVVADKFLADYDAKYLPEKYRTLAMSNELYANKTDKKTYDYYDQQGAKQQGEFTEYEWNKRLLADKVAEQKELFAADELKKVQDSANIFYKGLVGGWSVLRGVIGGTANAIGSIGNIFEGIYRGIAEGDEGFREAFKNNELAFVGDALRDWSYDWERNAGAYDYYGNRTSLASFVDGLGESVGRMLPSILVSQLGGALIPQGTTLDSAAKAAEAATKLSTASRAIFYASVASDNLADALNDASLSKLPTVALVARSTVQTALEVAVEDLLGKKFGRTAIDNLTYGLGSYAGRGVTVKSIIGNIGKDALQEGLEEVLQDYSHWFVDSFVSTAFKAFGNTEYANIFQNASQFNLNTAIDAFMAGAIMSMAGSMVQIIKSKRVDTGKPVVDKDGNIVYDKKGNIKTEKFGKFKSYLFNETAKSIIDNANAVLRDENISTRDRVVMMQALQSSMRTYSEMLGGLGEERLNKAVQMLSILNESYNIAEEIPDNILEQRTQYRKDTALAIEAFLRETRDEYRNIKITTKDADDMTEQNISEPVGLITATTEATDNATNTAKDVLKATGAEIVVTTKDGTGPVLSEDGKAVIVPEAQVTNLSSNQLVASIAETKLFRSISDDKKYAAAFGRILDIYKQLPKNKNADTTTNAFRRKCAAELVTNSDFVSLVLECNDKDVFDLVVTLQKETPKTISKLKDAIYRQRVNEAIADCKEVIIDYLCTKSIVIDYTAYPFLSQDDIMSIRAERWSLDIGYKIATDANYKPTTNDKRVFEIKVDASGVSNGAELKELFATDPKKAIGQLADEYYYNYYSKYDNKYYMKIGTVPNALMNQYLKSTGLNVPKLEKDIAKYQKDFELFTNGFYSFEISNGVCEVVELKRQTYTVARTETQKDYNIVYSVSGETIPNLINNVVTKDLPEKAKSQLSLNDIITNPSLWSEEFKQSLDELSPEAAYQSIKNKLLVQSDGQLSVEQLSDGTYVMANLAPMNKIITDTANDTFIDLANKVVNILYTGEKGRSVIDTEATSTIRLDNMYLSQGIPVQDIFKDEYVPDALQDHVIVFRDKGRPNITGSYDRAAKRIIVNLGTLKYIVKNAAQLYESGADVSLNDIQDLYEIIALQIKETVLHEYAHALQVANNLSSGFVDIFNVITDPAVQQQIINDIKRHMPGVVPAKKSIAKEVVTNLIYGNEAGEAGARGANNYRYTPFVSNVDEAGNMTLTTAWGSVYNLTEPRKSTFVRTKGDIAKATIPYGEQSIKSNLKEVLSKTSDKTFTDIQEKLKAKAEKRAIAKQERKTIAEKMAARAKITVNTQVRGYLRKYIGKRIDAGIFRLIEDVQVNQSSFDPIFVDLVKDGKITSKTAVADYLLRNDSNDTTLEYIIRDVFDSSISLKELKLSLYSAGDTYALQAIFKRLVNDGLITKKQMDDWLYNPHNINAFISTIVKLIKKSENSSEYIKLYKQITDKYNQTYDEQNQKLLRVYLIKNYDGTPNSLVKAAKYARIAALNPTDYDKKTRSIEETVSTSKNKNGSDDDITLEDTLADTRYDDTFEQFFSDDTVREMARAIYESRLTELAKKYNKLSKEQLRSTTFKRSIALKAQELLESIVSMNDSQIRREYDTLQQESKLSELEVKELRSRSSLQQNVQQKAKRAIEAIRLPTGKISKTLYKKLVKKYPDVGFKPDADLSVKNPDVWSMPTKDGHALDRADVSDLIDTMSNVYKYAVALTKQQQKVAEQKQKILKLSEQLSEAVQKEKALQEEIKQLRKEGKTVVKQEIDTETVYVDNSSPMPEKFKDLLDVVFSKLRETKGKFVQAGEMHTVKSYNEWLEATADTLSSLTTEDGNEILKYILSTNAIASKYGSDEDIKFDSVAMWTYSYLYSMRNKLNLDAELIQQVQEKFDHDKSRWGTLMSLSQRAMNELNPAATVFMAEARNYNIHFDKTDVVRLSDAIDDLKGTSDKKLFNEKMAKIQQLYNDMYNKALEEYKGNKRKLLDRILSFQKAAMLSGPGTWVRNITSNVILEASNNLSAKVGDLVWSKLGKIADIVAEKKRSKLKVPEYDATLDEGLSIANKMLDEDVKQMNRDDLSDAEKRLTKKYFVALKEADDQAKDRTLSKKHTEDIDKGIAKLQAEYLELTKLPKDDVKVEQRKYTLEAKIKERLQLKEMYANPDKVAADAKKAIDAVTKYSKYLKDIEAYESKIKSDPIHKSLKGQYKIVGTKVDSETIAFIKEYIIDSGLLKMLQSGLSKYDVSNAPKGDTEQLVDMIEKSIRSEIFANNQFNNKSLNKAMTILFQKILTDNKYIDRAFIKYLGAIIVEDSIDITRGVTREIQIAMTRAYTMACWDYMHGTNILYELETKIRSMLGDKAYFMYKQVFPFAGASMNWFIESLRYGPLGLGKAIKDFMSFEEYVAKMQSKAEAGQGPSEKFASYMLKRNLGKGLFGTATWLLGAVLAMLGVIKVVEDNYGNSKLQIGNTNIAIDIHDVQATTGFTLGAIMASAFNDDTTILDVMKTTLDAMFMDSTIGDAINTLRYSTGVGDLLLDTAQSSVQMFIPNILKVFNSSLYSHKIKYSSGLKGQLQRLGVQIIPGLAYAMPKYYDPYTGEQQVKYYPGFWGWAADAVNKFSPVKISPLYVSEMEKTALSLGLNKGSLKGEYSDTGAFTDAQVEQLNKKYGQLNKDELNKFRLGKSKYSVMMYDKNGNSLGYYKELTYQQMSNKQRKSVINRIMANNAKYAKIYVWTSAGHKYYTSKEERSELVKLGLYKNIFVKSKNKEGFIE